jgi:hypothetical protein
MLLWELEHDMAGERPFSPSSCRRTGVPASKHIEALQEVYLSRVAPLAVGVHGGRNPSTPGRTRPELPKSESMA